MDSPCILLSQGCLQACSPYVLVAFPIGMCLVACSVCRHALGHLAVTCFLPTLCLISLRLSNDLSIMHRACLHFVVPVMYAWCRIILESSHLLVYKSLSQPVTCILLVCSSLWTVVVVCEYLLFVRKHQGVHRPNGAYVCEKRWRYRYTGVHASYILYTHYHWY